MKFEISNTHPLLEYADLVRQLCTPLIKQSPIQYFDYGHYDPVNGSYYGLNTHEDIGKHYLEECLYPNAKEFIAIKHIRYAILSPDVELPPGLEKIKMQQNIQMADQLGITHRFYILKINEYSIEHYGFGTSKKIKTALQFFLNYIETFENFIHYFDLRSKKIIQETKKQSLILPAFKNEDYSTLSTPFSFQSNNLSKRQLECLWWLTRNKTAKEIAKILNLSHRTVEDYISQIKIKLTCSTKQELVEYAFQNFIFSFGNDHSN